MTAPYFKYPRSWEIATLEPFYKSQVILEVFSGGTPSTKEKEYWDGVIPWLTPKEICNGKGKIFINNTERTLTPNGLKNSGAKIMKAGTVMLTKRAPVGQVVINKIPMSTNQGFLNFACGEKLDPLFLYFWFKANKPYLYAVANGSTYQELYSTDLFEFQIGFPNIEDQKLIVKFLISLELMDSLGNLLESTIYNVNSYNTEDNNEIYLKNLKSKILIAVMSGNLKINEAMRFVNVK